MYSVRSEVRTFGKYNNRCSLIIMLIIDFNMEKMNSLRISDAQLIYMILNFPCMAYMKQKMEYLSAFSSKKGVAKMTGASNKYN